MSDVSARFTAGWCTDHTIGEELSAHFPYEPGTDTNELPDEVDFDR